MYSLPTSIKLGDKEFGIRERGDFRLILDCFEVLQDAELSEKERFIACLIIFYEDINSLADIDKLPDIEEAIKKMNQFFNCNEPEAFGAKTNFKAIDWKQDSQIICAAVNNVARTEIRALPYLHWWTFMGYYIAVGESVLSTVVSIRSKTAKGKKLEKWEREFKKDNPQYFLIDSRTLAQKEATEEILELWNKGK